MDPIAHTFTGGVLAGSGLRRATPLASAALIIGANAPDIDVLANLGGEFTALAWRRGWTHGVLALVVLPFVVTGALLAWDRWRRRARPDRPAPRAGPLLGLATLGVWSHPTLDWLNNYGLRWLMPFDGRWFYGDALFIIDPWVWLVLGGVLFVGGSRSTLALCAWGAFWLVGSWLVVSTPAVPPLAQVVWLVGVVTILAARFGVGTAGFTGPGDVAVYPVGRDAGAAAVARPGRAQGRRHELAARLALAGIAAYMVAELLANIPARAEVRAALEGNGAGPVRDVMVAPSPADPFAGTVVAVTDEAYHLGTWHWFARPRLRLDPEPLERPAPDDPVVAAAAATPDAQRFLIWSRFPHVTVTVEGEDRLVRFVDARYLDRPGTLEGPVVRLGPDHIADPSR